MWLSIAEPYKKILEQNGLIKIKDFISYEGGKVLKRLPSRTVRKIELKSRKSVKTFFMKSHKGTVSPTDALRSFFSGFSISWGRKEWDVIQAFHENGIPTLTAVAAGEEVSLFHQESFLITEELQGFQSLEIYLQTQFILPLSKEKVIIKKALIKEVADIARTMHRAGFNHRDFYCCHIFIKPGEDGKRQWRVLDLQRVDRRRWFRERWIIKDLAALNFSAPAPLISRTDRLRFMNYYLYGAGEVEQSHSFIRKIISKTNRIRQHDIKLKRKNSNVSG